MATINTRRLKAIPGRSGVGAISWVQVGCAVLMSVVAVQIGCGSASSEQRTPTLALASASFSRDTILPKCSSCNGQDGASPELSWKAPPTGRRSFALIATDKDSPFGFSFVHWVLYNVPPDKRELQEGMAKLEELPDGSRQGHNDYDRVGYVGPCPPGHALHRYVFDLYALDTKLDLPPRASKKQLVKAMKGHVMAFGELVGRFQQGALVFRGPQVTLTTLQRFRVTA
jgi:Raf kinase inhibitor-like YbhB/YbcL family protein